MCVCVYQGHLFVSTIDVLFLYLVCKKSCSPQELNHFNLSSLFILPAVAQSSFT